MSENRHALVVGISEYDDPEWDPLPQARDDAMAMAAILQRPDIGDYQVTTMVSGGFNSTQPLFSSVQRIIRRGKQINHNITGKDLQDELQILFNGKSSEDTVLFYFSGHGKLDNDRKHHMCSCETKKKHDFTATIHQPWLINLIKGSDAGRVYIIIDACHAGAYKGEEQDIKIEPVPEGKGGYIITSTDLSVARARHDQSNYSLFTHHLIQGLATGGADHDEDGVITPEDVWKYTRKALRLVQRPQFIPDPEEEGILILAYNPTIKRKPVPFWLDEVREPDETALMLISKLEKQHFDSELDRLLTLYLLRHQGKTYIPEAYHIDERIEKLEEYVFPERRSSIYSIDIKWNTVLLNQDDFENRIHLSKHPITNSQYNRFINAPDGYCNPKWWDYEEAYDWRLNHPIPVGATTVVHNHPRTNVSWYDAVAFCRWLSEHLQQDVFLPSSLQRHFAANPRGFTRFPWGDEFSEKHLRWCNIRGSKQHGLTAVAKYEKVLTAHGGKYSVFGLLDLWGNVWEWCWDGENPAQDHIVIGGSWKSRPKHLQYGYQLRKEATYHSDEIGFRVCLFPHAID